MLMELKNVSIYTSENLPYGNDVLYFRSEDGEDFYEAQPLFTQKYKLCIDPDGGVIRSISEDVSTLYPAGFTVVETNVLPEGCDINGGWVYKNGIVSAVPTDYATKANEERQHLVQEVNDITSGWLIDLQLGDLSDDDEASLRKWRAYVKVLAALDLSAVVDKKTYDAIVWPDKP